MDARMSVVIDLETKNLQNEVKNAQQEVKRLEKAILDLRKAKLVNPDDIKAVQGYNREIQSLSVQLKEQRISLRESTAELKARTAATKQATSAQRQFRDQAGASNAVALEFNRIIQDAPFGIIGVGNNLQQLAGNFSALRASAGGTGAAISAAFSSILSPVNLALLGISAITSLWTAYQLGVFDSAEETKSLEQSLEDYNEEVQKTIKNLSAFDSVNLNMVQGLQSEKIELDALFSVLRDNNLSQQVRIGAYNTLIKKYPNLLKGLTLEKALANDLTTEYNLLAASIEKRALANALQSEFESSFKEELQTQRQLNKETNTRNQIEANLNSLLERQSQLNEENSSRTVRKRVNDQIEESNIRLEKQNVIIDLTKRLLTAQGDEATKLKSRLVEVNKELLISNGGLENGLGALVDINLEADKLKRTFEDINKLPSIGLPKSGDLKALLEQRERLEEGGKVLQTPLELAQESQRSEFDRNIQQGLPVPTIPDLEKQIQNLERLKNALPVTEITKIQNYNFEISQLKEKLNLLTDQKVVEDAKLLTDSLSGVFSAMAQQISSSLNISNDSLKAFVGTLLSNAPKIVKAVMASASARKKAADMNVASSSKEAAGEGISLATKLANALGPVGMALLPVFIGGAMALIGGAFRKIGGNVPSGGGGGSAVRSASMNTAGSSVTGMGTAFNPFGDMQLRTVIRGTNIELLLERVNQERRA